MSEEKKVVTEESSSQPKYSLNDDRRVKVLSPSALVAKRFFRNRVALVGLVVLIFMFAFSFIGGLLTPYKEDELFYRTDILMKEYAAAIKNTEFRYVAPNGQKFDSMISAQMALARSKKATEFTYKDVHYLINEEHEDLISLTKDDGTMVGIAYKMIISPIDAKQELSFEFQYHALQAMIQGGSEFEADGKTYSLQEDGAILENGKEIAYMSEYAISSIYPDVFLTRKFKDELIECLNNNTEDFIFTDEDGQTSEYVVSYDPDFLKWTVKKGTESRVYDTYSSPSAEHWLGTDRNGMDMMTRLMYGGRVSLVIGFIVEIISTVIGVILGGISGYFGGWVDNLIMRVVDIFYCIPSMPIIIILGAAMDMMGVDPKIRMIYLMLILGLLGWAGIARLVRGQILSLREQEFMTATEACGLSVSRRIFKHLIPNVIPQLIVSCTMGLGGTIITEATLSFLGLGVKFPFASWGNIINDVNNTYVLTTYWFIWIPAGVLLLATVLAFNLVGDGLRDAFDPKMKR